MGRLRTRQRGGPRGLRPFVRVVADSHAIVWYGLKSSKLSARAREVLAESLDHGTVVLSIITLVELWYVSQTTKGVSLEEIASLKDRVVTSSRMSFYPVDGAVADAFVSIDRTVLADPWDRFIVATALALDVPLVTRDHLIQQCGLVETIW